MPICPHCGAEVQPQDIFCGNCRGDLRAAVGPEEAPRPELPQEGEALPPAEEEIEEELPSPPEALPEAESPPWMSLTSRTLWIVVAVMLLMLLCCCGVLGVIALARILRQAPALPPQPLL